MTGGAGQRGRIDAAVMAEMQPFRTVPMPLDVTDAEQFPEIAAAIEWARKQREARHG